MNNPSQNGHSNGQHSDPSYPAPVESLSEDIRRYFAIIWRRAWLLVLFTVLAGVIGFFYSQRQPRIYQAEATVLIRNPPSALNTGLVVANESLAETFSIMMVQGPIVQGVIDELELELTPAQVQSLKNSIDVEVLPFTLLIEVRVTNQDPVLAAQIANTISTVFSRQIEKSQTSTYSEMKENLDMQLASTEQQIEETLSLLETIDDNTENEIQRTQLETRLAVYRDIYTNLLQQSFTTTSPESSSTPSIDVLQAKVAELETQIAFTVEEQNALGVTEGLEYDLLHARLEALQESYQNLLTTLVETESGLADDGSSSDEGEVLAAQIAHYDGLILETLSELSSFGESATAAEMDRLESNLALYRQTYANLVQSIEEVRLAEIESSSKVDLVDPAVTPTVPVRPNVPLTTVLFAVVGLFAAGGLVIIFEILDDTFKGPKDVESRLGLPVLSTIHHIDEPGELPQSYHAPRSPVAEAFRALRTSIRYAGVDQPLRNIMVTSSMPGEGKSTVVANLGVVFAQGNQKVAVFDGDLRRPSLHKQFNVSNRQGLTDLFMQPELYLDGNLKPTPIPDLSILSSGGLPPNPAELISSNKINQIFQELHKEVDIVLIDTPPINAVTDAVAMVSNVDGIVMVIRVGSTKIGVAKQAVEQLRRAGANLLGVVLNDVDNKNTRSYRYYYSPYYSARKSYSDPQ